MLAEILQFQAWLVHREYSRATIQKYTYALTRFFRETGAGRRPDRETVAAWRDALVGAGYTPATVNAMLAAVNDYQESIDNPAGKAKPLKRQRKIFCDADRELSREEYFRLLRTARETGSKVTLLLLQTICSTGIRVSELKYITVEAIRRPRDPAAGGAVHPPGPLVPATENLRRTGICLPHWGADQPCHGLEKNEGPVQPGQRGVEKGLSPQPAAPVCQDLL